MLKNKFLNTVLNTRLVFLKPNFSKSIKNSDQFFFRELLLRGVGFKFAILENSLFLRLGFSHYISLPIPISITAKARKDKLIIFGSSLQEVSSFAALVRGFRAPDSYKFKGVSYTNEPVIVKVGKQR